MTTRRQRDFLKSQLIEIERLREMAGDDPFVTPALNHRRAEFQQALQDLPVGQKEPRTVLMFSGSPVRGSVGIDAIFASRVVEPFQGMVMADYAHRFHGAVGSRGRQPGEEGSRLLLTGLPRGSFGLELSKADDDELLEDDNLADTLSHVTKLVESAARSDEDFASELEDSIPRVVSRLRDFLGVIAKHGAGLSLESGDARCALTPAQAESAFERVSETQTEEREIELKGRFRGVLLDSWRFDFVDDSGRQISGKLDDSLSRDQASDWNRNYFDRPCVATLGETIVAFRNGRISTTYRLLNLNDAE